MNAIADSLLTFDKDSVYMVMDVTDLISTGKKPEWI